jgi:hypothetical protein
MAKPAQDPPATDPPADQAGEAAAPSNAELASRIDGLDSTLHTILDKLGGTETTAHAAAQQHTEDRLDRPTGVAEEIRAQLAARDQADAAAKRDKDDADWRASVDGRLAGMAEHAPEPPVRRVERMMWGGR